MSDGRNGPADVAHAIDLLIFRLELRSYALPLTAVARVVLAVDVTPLPGAPPSVLGVIDVEGELVPVFSLRRRLGIAEREISPHDQFVIATTARRRVALVVDEACGIVQREPSAIAAADVIPSRSGAFEGIVTLSDGLALIHDPEKFLSPDEMQTLDEAVEKVGRNGPI